MIVSTELLQTALCLLKRAAGSETEGPVFFMNQACGRLWLSIDQGHISTLVKVSAVGEIRPAFVPLNPIYYFAKNIKSRAIEITGEENITATSLSTQERLTVPATHAGPPERPVFHAAEETIKTKDLLSPLNLVSLPLEEEDMVTIRMDRLPSRLPSIAAPRPSLLVETGTFCQMLKGLGLITKGTPSS